MAETAVRHRRRVMPVKQKRFDNELRVMALRVVAYRAECACDWRGPYRSLRPEAVLDSELHAKKTAG